MKKPFFGQAPKKQYPHYKSNQILKDTMRRYQTTNTSQVIQKIPHNLGRQELVPPNPRREPSNHFHPQSNNKLLIAKERNIGNLSGERQEKWEFLSFEYINPIYNHPFLQKSNINNLTILAHNSNSNSNRNRNLQYEQEKLNLSHNSRRKDIFNSVLPNYYREQAYFRTEESSNIQLILNAIPKGYKPRYHLNFSVHSSTNKVPKDE